MLLLLFPFIKHRDALKIRRSQLSYPAPYRRIASDPLICEQIGVFLEGRMVQRLIP